MGVGDSFVRRIIVGHKECNFVRTCKEGEREIKT